MQLKLYYIKIQIILYNLEDYNKIKYTSIKITAGASNDLLQANRIARQYIKLFEIYLNDENRNILSDSTKSFIDDRTQSLIEKSLKKAIHIIENDLYHFHFYTNKLLNKKIINF